jgi:hypothetical protein
MKSFFVIIVLTLVLLSAKSSKLELSCTQENTNCKTVSHGSESKGSSCKDIALTINKKGKLITSIDQFNMREPGDTLIHNKIAIISSYE